MTIRPRTVTASLVLALVAVVALALAGCGSGGSTPASSSTDVDQLLKDTFSDDKSFTSGKVSLSLRVDAKGGSQGPISFALSGPFESQGKGKLPKLALKARFQGAGQDIAAGVTSTGDTAFVNFRGTDYAVTPAIFEEFKKGYEQAQAQADQQKGQSLATLGIDPRRWLKNPRNAGEVKVGGDDAIKITGDVDVPKLLDDVNAALEKARSLGVQGSANLPQKLTPEQRKQAVDAIQSLAVEIDTGKDDRILRRMLVDLDLEAPQGTTGGVQSAKIVLDVQFTDVNKGQDIAAPSDAKPLDQLLGQLGGLSALGGTGGSGSGSGSGGGASSANLEKYAKCIEAAGNDAAQAGKCADLLTTP